MNRFVKSVLVLIFFFVLVLTPIVVLAQEEIIETTLTATAEEVAEINSFELFWPIVAGKTMGDPLYFFKSLKEKVRGWLIFGKPQKAEYAVFLATKRVVETEKLINEGQKDLANKTLKRATSQLNVAEKSVDATKGSLGNVVDEINNKLDNLEKFIPWLAFQNEEFKDELQSILEKVKLLNQKV